jgi:hypothetical protein
LTIDAEIRRVLRGTWHAARHPLPRAVPRRIVPDEAAHGAFGFAFLDWALPRLAPPEIARLGAAADLAIGALQRLWRRLPKSRNAAYTESVGDALARMRSDAHPALAACSIEECVREPLLVRGIPLSG